ncbi:hypothetical protein LTR85_011886 [Meristemomyces frigidus]|nr:hypothetical protein LTR85_011886 [Meristemomyces frigidus]
MLRQLWMLRIVVACSLIAITTFTLVWRLSHGAERSNEPQRSLEHHALLGRQREFWRQIYHDLTESRPNCSKIVHDGGLDVVGVQEAPPPRPMKVLLEDQQHHALKTAHAAFTGRLQARPYDLPYVPATRGIVMTAGGSYLMHALVSVRMIRRTGTNMPIEVFLRDPSEGDSRICEDIFPSLNAKCIALSSTLGDDISNIGKYGYKMISMLLSSFEDFLYLDADCFPIHNPETLFEQPPFTTHGLVLWPDFWYPTESPFFFDIANIGMPPMDHSQVASEAGTILYSKRTHSTALLIATYYNFYGPDFYYKLHSQGALGEGDKETFRWSAVTSNTSWYQVKAHVQHLGFTTQSGERRDSVMAQYNPMTDFKATTPSALARIRPFFMHQHNPKLDPGWMFALDNTSTIFDSNGSMRRIWHENVTEAQNYFGNGFDAEMGMWEEMRDMTCEYDKLFHKEACEVGVEYVKRVFGG